MCNYKRPKVLDLTLESFLKCHEQKDWKVTFCIYDNQSSFATNEEILRKWADFYEDALINFSYYTNNENIGKDAALNFMLNNDVTDYDIIASIDNDMVLLKPWYWLLDTFMNCSFDYVGFASKQFWMHIPKKDECLYELSDYCNKVYQPQTIAGGLLLFKPEWIRAHPWKITGGVYGMTDGNLCLSTQNRAVFYWDEDWLVHDPLTAQGHYSEYNKAKLDLNAKGINIFKERWDE